ncbi:hypothetical protein ACJJIE_14415 [Microbulbifer sp. TRSA001]|uniref:hypothetical protein n=1 Tax=unclassified Microbulbifer TaxID=2619833 RepID=UPI0024ADDC25|nr:hypothetical protein [Microbulbifer sp. VAAF005]WHI45402.1 hypothetical protein P0078_16940 [Microbulbifer sp. VAAF005]
MKSHHLKLFFFGAFVALFVTACGQDEMINSKVEQSILLQQHSFEFATACKGKLSVQTEFTGDMQKPAVTKLSCDDMNTESDFFKPYTEEEIENLTNQIKRINNVE